MYDKGLALATHPHQRIYADVKLLNYVEAILAHQTVVPRFEADDVVFVNPSDHQTNSGRFHVYGFLCERGRRAADSPA